MNIYYGFPAEELGEIVAQGHLVLGGCNAFPGRRCCRVSREFRGIPAALVKLAAPACLYEGLRRFA